MPGMAPMGFNYLGDDPAFGELGSARDHLDFLRVGPESLHLSSV